MTIMRMFATSVVAITLLGAPLTAAVAGEVKGPPSQDHNTNETAAPAHANSACSYSGLNDMDSEDGQVESKVQTAADSWKYYGTDRGYPGTSGACRGGSN
jgi:hypothetical protein